jgi:repressor LexA
MNDNQRIGARIRQARKEINLSQEEVGKRYGSTTAFISQLECGGGVGIGTLQKLSETLGKPVSWFLEEGGDLPTRPIKSIISDFELATNQLKAVLIPILGSIPAGYPVTEEESVIDYLTVPKDMLNTAVPGEKVFALRVSGDSLQGDGIISGDMVVLDPYAPIQDGKIYALRLGNEVVLRHFYRENERIRLEAANPKYAAMFVDEVEILGQVLMSLRKY